MNEELLLTMVEFERDPLGHVLYSYPWGEPGELEDAKGPELWQISILEDLGRGLLTISGAIRLARTSGHGIGKSALVAWIIIWAMSTRVDCYGVVTANTETQLKTKTWVQLAKWYRLFIGKALFKLSATRLCSVDPEHEDTWRIDMVPWSERNTEAFAGLHNLGKRILLIFDEASAIPDIIWETAEGALTDRSTQIIWCVFGNPTRNKGRFRECFPGGKFAHRWNSAAIDSRSVSFTDKDQIEEWRQDYGEDHDFFRVRVRGVFPRVDSESFIPLELAYNAVGREVSRQNEPIVIGVDVGRFGDDPSVIYPRAGLDAISWKPEIMQGLDTQATAARAAATCISLGAAAVFVDEGGVGGGVVDRLRVLRIPVFGVDFGSGADGTNPDDGTKYANKRAEIWGAMRTWLKRGAIPDMKTGEHTTLVDELIGPNYGMNTREEIQLESKKEMRKRGIPSPNVADALACTFAFQVWFPPPGEKPKPTVVDDYNPYALERLYEGV
jgi:hypothetical protein